MLIWTANAVGVLRDATAKAERLNHREVHPLHLLWALTGKSGLNALRNGKNDHQQARIRFQVERDLNKLSIQNSNNAEIDDECATLGQPLQHLLLRAADFSSRTRTNRGKGRIGEGELLRALLPDDHRAASLIKAREDSQLAIA